MTIRRRIALVSAAAVAVAVVLIAVGAFLGAKRQVMSQIDDSLLERADVVGELKPGVLLAVLGIERATPRGRIVPPRPGDFDTSYYQVILSDGRVINIGDDDLVLPAPPPSAIDTNGPTLRSEWVDDVHLRIATSVQDESVTVVQLARPLTEVDALLGRLAILLLIGGLVGVALAAGLGLVVANAAVKPIDALRTRVAQIARSRSFTDRVDVQGDDEVAALSQAFNMLLDELESAKEEQVRLVRDAGHELRTPLTALRTNIEVLQRHDVKGEDRKAMLASARSEVEELALLVGEVVDLATERYEEEPFGPIELGGIAVGVAERFSDRRGGAIEVSADGSVVLGKRDALERALSNVVGNAVKFSTDEAPIHIGVSGGKVTVADNGPGFERQDLPHVFERFYRSDTARSEPGSGLGLSIVAQVVKDHGGEVFARNGESGGAEVGFSIPTEDRIP